MNCEILETGIKPYVGSMHIHFEPESNETDARNGKIRTEECDHDEDFSRTSPSSDRKQYHIFKCPGLSHHCRNFGIERLDKIWLNASARNSSQHRIKPDSPSVKFVAAISVVIAAKCEFWLFRILGDA
jgi:hypothetical protein